MPRYATVIKKSVFDMAHRNPGFGEGHKCNNIHGHTINYEVHVKSPINEETGLSIDFGIIKLAMKELVDNVLDHKYLNEDVPYFRKTAPSAENIAYFIFEEIQSYLDHHASKFDAEVVKVILHETPTSAVMITIDDFPYPPGLDFRAEVSE